jgi:dolichol-phosphate mannosyltransferase
MAQARTTGPAPGAERETAARRALERVHIVIPTYNERANIVPLVEDIVRLYDWPDTHIWVADDNSPDGTAAVVAELGRKYRNIRCIVRTGQRGYGVAVADGMRAAMKAGARLVLTMDADYAHDPAAILPIVKAAAGADLVIGSRYLPGEENTIADWSLLRRWLSRCANTYVRVLTRVTARDATSGFRCWRVELLRDVLVQKPRATGYAFLPETLYYAGLIGARIHEVTNLYHGRVHGESKLTAAVVLESMWTPLRLRCAWMLRRARLLRSGA